MPSELEVLEAKAFDLAVRAAGRPEGEGARRLAERLGAGRFQLLVVGEFNRGKSTLVNALLGEEVVPTGVLPLTAVTTELSYGDPAVLVEHLDGSRLAIPRADLALYVTEEGNPGNERQVGRVEIRGLWPLLKPGVILVDTPGIGSIYQHNTDVARAALVEADGAVVVFSADAPLSEQELTLLATLTERRAATFFVLNKCDHLGRDELDTVRRYLGDTLRRELGRNVRLYAVDARAAMASAAFDLRGTGLGADLDAFVIDLERFVATELVGAKLETARHELARLGGSLRDSLAVERAALDLDAAGLARQAERFAAAAREQRRAFDDDRAILGRDVAVLADAMRCRLAAFAERAPAEHFPELDDVAVRAPRRRLADELRSAVETAVLASFEAFRQQEAERTDAQWRAIAERFRARTERRVDAVRQTAARLFNVPLPQLHIPVIAEEQEQFFYLFLHVGSSTEPFERLVSRLVPGTIARPRALARARTELVREFDKHAGRARWDLSQRLEEVRRDFERDMRAELDAAVDAITVAASRAKQLHLEADQQRRDHAAEADHLETIALSLTELAQPPPTAR